MTDANKIPYIDNEFVSAVKKMRKAQVRFRKEKNTPNYKAMIKAEQDVDSLLAERKVSKAKEKRKPLELLEFD